MSDDEEIEIDDDCKAIIKKKNGQRAYKLKLTPREKMMLERAYAYGFNLDDVAALVGLSRRSIYKHISKKRLQRAKLHKVKRAAQRLYKIAMHRKISPLTVRCLLYYLDKQGNWENLERISKTSNIDFDGDINFTLNYNEEVVDYEDKDSKTINTTAKVIE
jgi:predicted DNA-binding protein YlxM (UPF0122 family)